jgi:hypothetical protein
MAERPRQGLLSVVWGSSGGGSGEWPAALRAVRNNTDPTRSVSEAVVNKCRPIAELDGYHVVPVAIDRADEHWPRHRVGVIGGNVLARRTIWRSAACSEHTGSQEGCGSNDSTSHKYSYHWKVQPKDMVYIL